MTTMINPSTGPLPDGLPSAEPVLFQQTVPRHLVHRTSSSEVFVTGLRVLDYNTFVVSARWPGAHAYYGPTTKYSHDPILLLETLRQAGLLIAHVAFEVPLDYKFITHEKQFDITPIGLRTNGLAPVDVEISVTAHDIRRRGRGFAGMLFEYTCFRNGVEIAKAAIRWSCVSAAGYARLRGEHFDVAPPVTYGLGPVRPELVGRSNVMDVMLSEAPGVDGWMLRIDPDHPVVFDHSVDHVPGMAAVEAARQAALIVLGRPLSLPIRGDFALQRYVEFDQPCLVFAELDSIGDDRTRTIRITFEQDGHTAAEGTLGLLVC